MTFESRVSLEASQTEPVFHCGSLANPIRQKKNNVLFLRAVERQS
jgi:hypothetical protein